VTPPSKNQRLLKIAGDGPGVCERFPRLPMLLDHRKNRIDFSVRIAGPAWLLPRV